MAAGQATSSQSSTSASPNAQVQKPATPAESSSAKPKSAESKEVGSDAAVVTIKGICPSSAPKAAASKTAAGSAAAKPAACEKVITKKELEQVIDAVRPNIQPAQRRMLAQQYAELLVIGDAASKAGLEKDPKVQEQLRLQKLQVLASSYTRKMQEKDAEVPQADIEKYYKDNSARYEEAKLLRIYVPMVTPEEGKPPDAAATKALAEKVRERAAAGEDFDQLQKDAFTGANSKGTPPSTDMGERRRSSLPPKQEEPVFSLKAGEVSPALEETSGYYIYKVVSKEEVPLDKVHDEIKGTLGRERFRGNMEKMRSSATMTFNDAYFGSGAPPATAGAPAPPPGSSPRAPAAAPEATTPGMPEAPKPAPPASTPNK
ncbi:MAG TPA: peptidyl-prolyl cis-trans isomerase [Terriglobales bacterium]|nr:peptidyl-prolyl cis-trans isomerase [Terriglobales bacterium]